jgi:hypothetical protein
MFAGPYTRLTLNVLINFIHKRTSETNKKPNG